MKKLSSTEMAQKVHDVSHPETMHSLILGYIIGKMMTNPSITVYDALDTYFKEFK